MAVVQLKVLLLLMWVAIPGLRCQDPTESYTTTVTATKDPKESYTTTVTATKDPFRESTTVDEFQSTKPDERGTSKQDATPIPGGGCLQRSKTPANLETACQFCEDNDGRLVDLHIFADHNLGTILAKKNITMWIQFDCTNSSARCQTFYPYKNVTCSEEYNYFCYHNETDDEKCRDVQDTTPTETPTTALTSTKSNGKPEVTPETVELTKFERSHVIYLVVGIIVFMVAVVVIAGYFIYRRHRNPDEGRGKEDRRERNEPEVVESDLPEVEQTLSCSQMKLQFIDEDTYDHLGVQKRKENKDDSSNVYGHLIQEPNEGDYDTTNFKGPSTEVVDKLYARSNFETSDT